MTGKVKTTFGAIVRPSFTIQAHARATFSGGTAPLCVLALNPSVTEALKVWGTADLIAPDCAVRTNSTAITSMVTGGAATALAKGFCAVGSYSGNGFTPKPKSNCGLVDDPYADKYTYAALAKVGYPVAGAACTNTGTVSVNKKTLTYDASKKKNKLWVFCGGMKISAGGTAVFKPGLYAIYSQLSVSAGSTIEAPEGVTFLFMDAYKNYKPGYLDVQAGANLHLVAPTSGPLAGMAIINPAIAGYAGGSNPVLTHTVIGGGSIDIIGTFYAPQAEVLITGKGTINSSSRYFSLVADTVRVQGNGILQINAGGDAQATGMPTMAVVDTGIEAKITE